MQITPFATEHFYAQYEFNTPHQLCNSDCEALTVAELLELAGRSAADLGRLHLGYTESQGNHALREAIAALYATATAEEIIVLGSPVEGIYLAARALLQPGDEVIVLTPGYDALINMFEYVAGADYVKRWPFTAAPDRWELDVEQLKALLSPRTRLVVINFPHNPTGYLPTADEFAAIVAAVAQAGVWLLCDEMYRGLVLAGTEPIPSAVDLYERTVVLSGLSKTYGLPGLRSGWLVVRDAAMRANLLNWKFYTSICPPAPTEFLALAALEVEAAIRTRNVAIIEENLILAEEFFGRWAALFTWRRPRAGSTALVGLNLPSASQHAHRLAHEAGVLVHPAVTLGAGDGFLRFGFGRRSFATALDHYQHWLGTQYPHAR